MQHTWKDISAKLEASGINIERAADFTDAPVCHGATYSYNIPSADKAERGIFSTNNNYFSVTDHDGRTVIGHLGDNGGKVERNLENMGFTRKGGVAFSNNELTGTTDAVKLAHLRGKPLEEAEHFISPHFATNFRGNIAEDISRGVGSIGKGTWAGRIGSEIRTAGRVL